MRRQDGSTFIGFGNTGLGQLRVAAALLLLLLGGGALAENLSPERFVTIELAVRQMTLEDMEARLQSLQNEAYDQEYQQSEAATARIGQFYVDQGTSPHGHAGYGAEHVAEIEAWLDENPSARQQLSDLNLRFESLSKQFNTLMTGVE